MSHVGYYGISSFVLAASINIAVNSLFVSSRHPLSESFVGTCDF